MQTLVQIMAEIQLRILSKRWGAFVAVKGLDLTIAEPLRRTDLQARRGDTRFLVSLTTQFGVGR